MIPRLATIAGQVAKGLSLGIGQRGWGEAFTRELVHRVIPTGSIPSQREIVSLARGLGGKLSRNTVSRAIHAELQVPTGQVYSSSQPLSHTPEALPAPVRKDGTSSAWWSEKGRYNYTVRITPVDSRGRPLKPHYRTVFYDEPVDWATAMKDAEEAKARTDIPYYHHTFEYSPESAVYRGPSGA